MGRYEIFIFCTALYGIALMRYAQVPYNQLKKNKMKKIIFSAAVLALAAIGAFKATSTNDYAFNELQMENIEMLAQAESSNGGYCRYDEKKNDCFSWAKGAVCLLTNC